MSNIPKKTIKELENCLIEIDNDFRNGGSFGLEKMNSIITEQVLGLTEEECGIIRVNYEKLKQFRLKSKRN